MQTVSSVLYPTMELGAVTKMRRAIVTVQQQAMSALMEQLVLACFTHVRETQNVEVAAKPLQKQEKQDA